MPARDYYTLPEAAQILDLSQRRLLDLLESGEIEGERDPQSGRWKIPKQAADERAPRIGSPRTPKSLPDSPPRCSKVS